MITNTKPLIAIIDSYTKSILHDYRSRHDFLNHKGQFSLKKATDIFSEILGETISNHDIVATKEIYHSVRSFIYAAQGIAGSNEQILKRHSKSIALIKESGATSCVELHLNNRSLYSKLTKLPESKVILSYSELTSSRPLYWYLDDESLLQRCSKYSSWREAHNRERNLHKHITGRNLKQAVEQKYKVYLTGYYVGLDGNPYQSKGELFVANSLFTSKIAYQPHENIFLDNKIRRNIDFLFEGKRGLEVLQIEKIGNRKDTRTIVYVKRNDKKKKEYKGNIEVKYFCFENYIQRGVVNTQLAYEDLRILLKEINIKINKIPPGTENLIYFDKDRFQTARYGSEKEILQWLYSDINIKGIKDLQDNHSHINNILSQRKDIYTTIRSKIKEISNEIKRQKYKERLAERAPYSDIETAKKLAKINRIESQKQWFLWAKENKATRIKYNIPSNVYSIYRKAGTWNGWNDFLHR